MRKQYSLTVLLLCSLLGTIYSKSGVPYKTYFPDCELTVTASSTEKDTICLGSSVDLVATASNGTTPYTYSWLPTAGLSNSHIANPVATPTVSTNYTVTVTDHSGCTATASVSIIVNQPPVVVADSLLEQYLTNRPLTAVGGTPPYTYNFSPAISTSGLVTMLTSTVTTIYTITVTGANGCANVYHATYTPLQGITAGACRTPFISEYIQDTIHNNDGIEIYNPSSSAINMNTYYLAGTTNGSLYATPFFIALHGTIAAHSTFLIANTYADTSLTHKAGMLSDSLSFGGKDIVTLLNINISVSGVQTTALDMVGTISPLPTDSGWAVGAGSTKNHTLTRQTSVVQGDMNWTTCKTEWNVYPRGTFTYIGHYKNICTPTDPQLMIYLGSPSPSCDSIGYVNFPVMVACTSTPPTQLNNCMVDILISGGEFAGDNFSNNGIIVTEGHYFQPAAGNDYNYFDSIDISADEKLITIGDTTQNSTDGTAITSYGLALFNVSLRIQNSCETGSVLLVDTSQTAYFTDTTSHIICRNCVSPCDSCHPYICGYDSCANGLPVADSTACPDTCYHDWCCSDSIATSGTNVQYTSIYYSPDSITGITCGVNVLLPKYITAGTNHFDNSGSHFFPANSDILYIKGCGFGNMKDSVKVSNANAPGMARLDSTDILYWSENAITIRMPSFIINNDSATPGTGPITVYNACGGSGSGNLQIIYNIKNTYFSPEMARPNIFMATDSNSIIFRYDTSVAHNPQALACIKKAIREWNCYTGINWKLTSVDTLEVSALDGISTIYFNNSNFSPSSALMITQQELDTCHNLADSMAFYNEVDIGMKRDQYLPFSKQWNYDTTYTSTSDSFYYFYDVILHELGHAIGLGHINDPYSLMYYTTINGRRDSIPGVSVFPGPGTLFGAYDMLNTSASWPPHELGCLTYTHGLVILGSEKFCNDPYLKTPDIPKNAYNLNLYPNPINYGNLTISYDLTQNSQVQFMIFDCTGRPILSLNSENKAPGTYNEQVNVTSLAQGVYLFTANINGEMKTIKFVKL